jgi:hypothetical protein
MENGKSPSFIMFPRAEISKPRLILREDEIMVPELPELEEVIAVLPPFKGSSAPYCNTHGKLYQQQILLLIPTKISPMMRNMFAEITYNASM